MFKLQKEAFVTSVAKMSNNINQLERGLFRRDNVSKVK